MFIEHFTVCQALCWAHFIYVISYNLQKICDINVINIPILKLGKMRFRETKPFFEFSKLTVTQTQTSRSTNSNVHEVGPIFSTQHILLLHPASPSLLSKIWCTKTRQAGDWPILVCPGLEPGLVPRPCGRLLPTLLCWFWGKSINPNKLLLTSGPLFMSRGLTNYWGYMTEVW